MKNKLALFLLVLSTSSVFAKDSNLDHLSETLTVDQTIMNAQVINFPNDNGIYPEKSDFEIIHSVSLSNESGGRWATITLTNRSSGRRILKSDHILATLANGSRRFPHIGEHILAGNETLSITVSFGNSIFPILQLSTRN